MHQLLGHIYVVSVARTEGNMRQPYKKVERPARLAMVLPSTVMIGLLSMYLQRSGRARLKRRNAFMLKDFTLKRQ